MINVPIIWCVNGFVGFCPAYRVYREVKVKIAEAVKLFQGTNIWMSNKCKRFFFLTEWAHFLPWGSTAWWLELGQGVHHPFCPHECPNLHPQSQLVWLHWPQTHHKISEGCHLYLHHTLAPSIPTHPTTLPQSRLPFLCSGSTVAIKTCGGWQVASLLCPCTLLWPRLLHLCVPTDTHHL